MYLRFVELRSEFEDPVEKLLVPAKEGRLLRLAGHVENAKHDDDEYRDGSQNGYRHVRRVVLVSFVRPPGYGVRSVVMVTLARSGGAERHGGDPVSVKRGIDAVGGAAEIYRVECLFYCYIIVLKKRNSRRVGGC